MRKSWAGVPCALFGFLCSTLLVAIVSMAAAENPSRITVIDNTSRVRLPHSTHPLVTSANDLGRVDPNLRLERMLLIVGPADEIQPTLRAFIDGQHDRKSGNYHRWITPETFGERFGPSQQDIEKITSWLQQNGFDNIKPARGRTSIEFSGSAQLVQEAFATAIHYYQQDNEKHLANSTDISIPRAMSRLVRGVSLDNFSFSKPTISRYFSVTRNAEGKFVSPDPLASSGGTNLLAPGDFANIYDLNPLYKNNVNGTGSTIAVVARSNIVLSDVETFRQAFNLPPNDPVVILNGPDPGQIIGGDLIEASLDSQWTGAVAPNATVDFVVSQSTATTDGVLLSAAYIVDNNLADIMSMSFNLCEQSMGTSNAFFNALYQQAAAQGISVFVATGDAGAADCEFSGFNGGPATTGLAVNGLASTPFNTAIGGTQFDEGSSPKTTYWGTNGPGFVSAVGYIPETVWNESCDPSMTQGPCSNGLFLFNGTGGGVSTVYSKPSWQSATLTGVPNDNQRDVPDVSLTGANHDGYLVCVALFSPCTFTPGGTQLSVGMVGGTSASAQAFAGIMALVDQQQQGRQGLANYVLYKLAANETFANCNSSDRIDPTQPAPSGCVFNDTTVGNNGVAGNDTLSGTVPPGDSAGQVGYNATAGYDSATGLGSVDATNLVNAWNSVTFLGSTTTLAQSGTAPVQHGQPVSFNVNVAALSGSGTPSGEFVLIAKNAPAAFNKTVVGSGTLTNGAFSGPINSLPGGEYQVVAHYGGDGTFGGSESAVVPVNISAEGSSVAITGTDQNNVPFSAPGSLSLGYGLNQPLLVTVTTASGNGTPTGTITLLDGPTPIAQLPLNNNGQAKFINCDPFSALFCLSNGVHNLTVAYSGDSSSTGATSPALTVTVTKGTLVFGVFEGCCPANQTTEVEADFSTTSAFIATPPTGTVTFSATPSGSTTPISLGFPASLAQEGLVLFRWFELPAGTYTFSVNYGGDNNYLPGTATGAPVQVTQGTTGPNNSPVGTVPTQTVVTTTTNPVAEGQPVTFQVTVSSTASASTPTGSVDILAGASFIGAGGNLVNGTATVQGTMPNATLAVQAIYSGDTTFSPSASTPLEIATQKLAATLNLSASATTVQAGTQVSLLGTLTGPTGVEAPQGILRFLDSLNGAQAQPLGSAQLLLTPSSGAGIGTTGTIATILPVGVHTITAGYSGDNNYNPISKSSEVTVTVNAGAPAVFAFAAPIGGDTATVKSGQIAQFNVFLNSNGFVGTVTLSCSGAPSGTTCASNPATVDLNATVTSVPLVVGVGPGQSAAAHFLGMPFIFGIALGIVPLGVLRRNRAGKALLCMWALCLIGFMGGCGSSSKPSAPPPGPQTFTLTLTGTDGSTSSSIPLKLTVNP